MNNRNCIISQHPCLLSLSSPSVPSAFHSFLVRVYEFPGACVSASTRYIVITHTFGRSFMVRKSSNSISINLWVWQVYNKMWWILLERWLLLRPWMRKYLLFHSSDSTLKLCKHIWCKPLKSTVVRLRLCVFVLVLIINFRRFCLPCKRSKGKIEMCQIEWKVGGPDAFQSHRLTSCYSNIVVIGAAGCPAGPPFDCIWTQASVGNSDKTARCNNNQGLHSHPKHQRER